MRRLCLIALLPLAACSQAARSDEAPSAGSGASRSYAVTGFSAVDAAGPDDVDVRVGSGYSIRAEGDPKVLDRLEIVRDGDSLSIRRKQKSGFSWGGDRGAKVYVTMPRMTGARITGSGDMTIDHVEGDAFTAKTTGTGDLTVSTISVQNATLGSTGTGNLHLSGTAQSVDLSVTGTGDIDAPGLKAASATVSVTGPGSVRATVSGPATVHVTGPGDVTLTGGARCTVSKLGPGDVNCS